MCYVASKRSSPDITCAVLNTLFRELKGLKLVSQYKRSEFNSANGMVSWQRSSNQPFIAEFSELTIETYVTWVEQGDYTAILFDGSLLQTTYSYDRRGLKHHRLAYIPSPLVPTRKTDSSWSPIEQWHNFQDETATEDPPGFVDWVYDYLQKEPFAIGLRSTLRFDFDPSSARPGHPEAHLTLNSNNCRIPCVDIMEPEHFVRFIFQTFYPKEHSANLRYFANLQRTRRSTVRFLPEEQAELHVNWGNLV